MLEHLLHVLQRVAQVEDGNAALYFSVDVVVVQLLDVVVQLLDADGVEVEVLH